MKSLTLALIVCLLPACGEKMTVAQRVIATLHSMEDAAENGRHFDFMAYVADDFSGQQGSMDRRDFHRFMIFQINQNQRLQANFLPIYVTSTNDQHAKAHFRILVTGGAGLLPERGELFEVDSSWILDGDDWLLQSADWESVLDH